MNPSAGRKNFLILSMLAVLVCHAATSSAAPRGQLNEDFSEVLMSRGLKPQRVVLPFALTEEMRRWAHETVPKKLPAEKKVEILVGALVDPETLGLEYSGSYTGTAQEAFRDRRANCLAFTNLVLGMARELGVPLFFLDVESEIFRKEGDLVVRANHVAVGLGRGPEIRMWDFSEQGSNNELPDVRRIPDYTAVAMYYSNRGAETIREGRLAEAVGWLRTAVAIDPELAEAWNNLGVGLRRLEDLEGSEGAYRRAIETDPRLYSSYQNLAALLRLQGRYGEAEELQELVAGSPSRNPFTYLTLGDWSMKSQRLNEARRLYRRAARFSDDEAEPYAALGEVAVATGDLRTAKKMLRKAQRLEPDSHRTRRLAGMIVEDRD